MQEQALKDLLERYKAGKASAEDCAFLESWHNEHNESDRQRYPADALEEDTDALWHKLQRQKYISKRIVPWRRIAAVAAVLLFFGTGGFYLAREKYSGSQIVKKNTQGITPGSNKAVLTLANGKQITLALAKNGDLAQEDNAVIHKTADGQISYALTSVTGQNDLLSYNTVTTPRGGQYRLTLSDGTRVFLNAASSLRYPAAFTGEERKVELTGEAYFEVAHDRSKPFKVASNGQLLEVLGTHFNVNAYNDEQATVTTLLQGSVKINTSLKAGYFKVLKPGQQSVMLAHSNYLTVHDADMEAAVAWKNGFFQFDRADIKTIMRQISRWYNVEVEYKGNITQDEFVGRIERSAQLTDVLQLLKLSRIHFFIDNNKKIVVTP